MPRRLSLLLSLLLIPAAAVFAASGPVKRGAVTAQLVAHDASIQPGRPLLVALRLTHEEHWHSYWINAGTGYPTSLTWKLPPGFKAGKIQWPTPHVVQDTKGNVTGHGYEGQVFLFVEISTPADLAPGTEVTLQAKADWLMCKDVCMPGEAKLELTLPVKAEPPAPDMTIARLFNNARADLPQPLRDWVIEATRDAESILVRLSATAGKPSVPQGLHLFDEQGLVDYAAPQVVTVGAGVITFKLAAAKDADATAKRLVGVIAAKESWGIHSPSHGATFDVELKSGPLGAGGTPAVEAAKTPATTTPAQGTLAGTLLLALVGGLILNLMPCVFPVLGIKVLGFVNQSGSDRAKVVTHGLVFTLGVLLSFWTLAGLLLALRAGGAQLGWGFQLQSPGFVFGMAVFLLVFALNLSGLFEVGLSATGVGGKLQMQSGYSGSFFTGILATLVATPCSAPFLAPALGAALTLSAVESILVFSAIGLGLSAPYLLLSAFPAAVKMLPRPGAWMETFKQVMAFPLYATVGWLVWVLAGQTRENDNALLLILFGLVLVAMAVWAYGRWMKPAGRTAAAVLLVAGLAVGWPRSAVATPINSSGYAVKWEHWSPEAVGAARAAGRTVYVDFTARWCATCQTNKAAVFTSKTVLAELAKRNVLLLKADWTSKDPAITAELARWNRSAVPFNLIYSPGKPEPVVLPELLTPGIVLEYLAGSR